jgi:thermitase
MIVLKEWRQILARAALFLAVTLLSIGMPVASDDFMDDQVVVGLVPGASIDAVNQRYGTHTLEHPPGNLDYLLGTQPGQNIDALIQQMSTDPDTDYAEKNHTSETAEGIQGTLPAVDRSANLDTYQAQPSAAAVHADPAHAFATGDTVIVAVVDEGLDPANPQFVGRFAPGGFDFVDGDALPWETRNGIDDDLDGQTDEGYGHGTHVAGIILLAAPTAAILPIRVLDDEGRGSSFRVAEGIRHAVAHGARVINLSLAVRKKSNLIGKAIREAQNLGVSVVVAVGNRGLELMEHPSDESDVIAVSATDPAGVKVPVSNYGGSVTVSAPGSDVLSFYGSDTYARWGGTSMAAPFASGGAALLLERYPTLDGRQVAAKVRQTATDISGLNPSYAGKLGAGLLNLEGLATVAAATTESVKVRQVPTGTVVSWQVAEGASSYDLVRGNVGSLSDTGTQVQLGPVVCLANDTPSLAGAPDPDIPSPGQAFFYLMRTGSPSGSSSYGNSSTLHARVASSGDCGL